MQPLGPMKVLVAVGGAVLTLVSCKSTADPVATEPVSAEAPGDASAYKFFTHPATGAPARFNPCQAVHYVVNLDGAPSGAVDGVKAGVAMVGQATGIDFIYDGLTDEVGPEDKPDDNSRQVFQPDRYGTERWAPILISWAPLGRTAAFSAEGRHGRAYAMYVDDQTASGVITLNSETRQKSGWVKRAIMHELGHVVGLDHVEDRYSIMAEKGFASERESSRWSAGDAEGLRQLGRQGGCLPVIKVGPTKRE